MVLYYLITINKAYIDKSLSYIESLLDDNIISVIPSKELFLKDIQKNVGLLISELINSGFSKTYLFLFTLNAFVEKPLKTFKECWNNFKNIISAREENDYTVIFKLYAPEKSFKSLLISDLKINLTNTEFPLLDKIKLNSRVSKLLGSGPNNRFIIKQTQALDHYQALKNARTEVANMLDLIYLGYSDVKIEINDNVFIVNNRHLDKPKIHSIHYQIDGIYKSHDIVYKSLSEKILDIKKKKYIAQEVIDKIEAAVRFLRTGSDAIELEQKFLSYWIGLENVFSNYSIDTSTFVRIKKYFTIAHIISYTKRNAFYFHKFIKRQDVSKKVIGYNDNLDYLLDEKSFDDLIKLEDQHPLLALRSRAFKEHYFIAGNSEKLINKHKINLEQHLTRMYRIRNELVHNAATFQNIENITSNLRYYLTFILNKIIEFFCDCQEKSIPGKLVEMNDFFLYQEVVLNGLQNEKHSFKSLLKVPHPIENLV